MLETAAESGDTVPELLVCNINWDAMEQQGLSEGQQQIRDAFTEYGTKDYVMVQKGDVRVALLGVFGKDALACAPTCELQFTKMRILSSVFPIVELQKMSQSQRMKFLQKKCRIWM